MDADFNKSYLIIYTDFSDFYVPGALHIERNDALMLVETDEEARRAAERDGIKLIYGMDHIPDGVYIDTAENREIILNVYELHPDYLCFETGEMSDTEPSHGMDMSFGKG